MNAERARELHKDTRGAVMMTGLCMSCFLIGGLWFLMGIGDAIVFRDAMQEASDHAAFTSAVLHAKGMNFISACNLILVALIAIHILMGIIHDILLAICIISLGTGCGAWVSWRKVYTAYGKGFKMAANVIHYLEEGAAIGYPFLGLYKAYKVGDDYGGFGKKRDVTVLAFSSSLAPGQVMNGPINALFGQRAADKLPSGAQGPTRPATNGYSPAKKKFLPVEARPFNNVCDRIAKSGINELIALTGRNPSGKVMGIVKNIIGNVLKLRYCNNLGSGSASGLTDKISEGNAAIDEENAARAGRNAKLPQGGTPEKSLDSVKMDGIGGSIDPGFDTWWGKDGPLVPWGGTMNGSPWQQIWAINMMPEYKDLNQNKVALAERRIGQAQEASKPIYFAGAEFYFDCANTWFDYTCNGDDNAGYQIKWRARLVRFKLPQIGTLITSFAGDFLSNITAYKDLQKTIRKGLGDGPVATGAFSSLTKLFEGYAKKTLGGIGGVVNDGQNSATGAAGEAMGLVPYH